MDNRYLKLLNKQTVSEFDCQFCGSSLALDNENEGICQFCEGYIFTKGYQYASSAEKFADIHKMIQYGRVEEAKTALDTLTAKSTDYAFLYGAANIYKLISDLKYHDLNYSRQGFMEENSSNIYYSLDVVAKTKEMFYKVIALINGSQNRSPGSDMLLFLSYMKLKRHVDAGKTLGSLAAAEQSLEKQYFEMMYSAETDAKDSYGRIRALVSKGNYNAIYYLAKYYAKKRNLDAAKRILDKLNPKIRMPMAIFLSQEVDRLIEETKL